MVTAPAAVAPNMTQKQERCHCVALVRHGLSSSPPSRLCNMINSTKGSAAMIQKAQRCQTRSLVCHG